MIQTTSPYEFFGPTLCVRGPWLYKEAKVITKSNYDYHVNKGNINTIREGKGKNNYALVEFNSIYPPIKEMIMKIAPPPSEMKHNALQDLIVPDNEAAKYFAVTYKKSDGSGLKLDKQKEYLTNAILLNACAAFAKKYKQRKTKTWIWNQLSEALNEMEDYPNTLPTNPRSLQRAFDRYSDGGYKALVHGGEGNSNSRVVNERIENLVLSIYTMKNKPFAKTVHQIYLQFLGGAMDIIDTSTGEIFNPKEFEKNGSPITISEQTVWNIINDPKNRSLVDRYRSSAHEFNNTHRPHHHRHAPIFSLSKISLDDRDLPRKTLDGKRVKAYYAYDVISGAVVGASYSRDKDAKLFVDCIKDMLLFLKKGNHGVPMEMEVEHHIVNLFKQDLMKAGTCFPFVRWCAPGNSQEKRAEHFNKRKKYGYEKRYQEGIGRWYAKSEAYRVSHEKIFDAQNDNYKEKLYAYEMLVADDRETIRQYNEGLHPDQKKFKGLSRMDVLVQNENPNCANFEEVVWARYVGEHTTTTIKRSQYMRVQYADYTLPSVDVLEQLEVNNYKVDAYYIPEADGNISRIFIYQNDQFIAECAKIEKYNEATAEHTDDDKRKIETQSSYVKSFDTKIKEGRERILKLEITEASYPMLEEMTEDIVHHELPAPVEDEFEALLRNRDESFIRQLAKDKL